MRFDTLDQWLDWQSTLHPQEIELGLERVADVWQRLKPDGLESLVITVAGTNGKGSCVAMLDSIYRKAGYRVGVYTSPHLIRYNERIKLDGKPVEDRRLCEVFDAIDKARGDTTLTYFEFGTLAALYVFAEEHPDLVILEVGLGGRLDAVNIIDADLALISSIDLDHTDWLGETREEIGMEKAGIMRPGRPVVLADPEMPTSVFTAAQQVGARTLTLGRDYNFRQIATGWRWSGPDGNPLNLPVPALPALWQLQNAAAVVMACRCLQQQLECRDEDLAAGLEQVRLPGRLQLITGRPNVLLDVAHNPQAVRSLRSYLARHPEQNPIRAVFGLLHDKDATAVASIMGDSIEAWHLMDLPGNRGRLSNALAGTMRDAGITAPIHGYQTFTKAFGAARSEAKGKGLILIFGSFLVVGEAMQYLSIE
ncbi:MAG: bifunctional tetrahydrofolate synthase/dihydrofolate synthase [Candidatus Thiodiazotropha sp. (ex Gloverina cf. vestifex)]|nr:bifunctional tetrahydrofolate synthase/dihydrofolate synthase [Candidatus Thiodiazotropha sp. (ex Gloverina cf. vestifex)]